jgi:hypothetical protein
MFAHTKLEAMERYSGNKDFPLFADDAYWRSGEDRTLLRQQ